MCRCFGAVDLRAGHACERARRDERGRVDAQFRTIAQGQRLRPRDEIVRWLDQPLGIAADVQGVVLAAQDLTRRRAVTPYCSVVPLGLHLRRSE